MRATDGGPDRKAWTIAAAIVSACAWFGVPGDTAMAQAKTSDENGTGYRLGSRARTMQPGPDVWNFRLH